MTAEPDNSLFPVEQDTARRCGKCGEVRPLSMFYLKMEAKRATREGRTRYHYPCRVCVHKKNHARLNPRQQYVNAIKTERGCADCGIRSDRPEIYDFDHRPGEHKVAGVAALLTKGTMEDVDVEMAKCDVVCANCHRIRTVDRGREASP